MTLRKTEQQHDLAQGLDTLAPSAILSALVEGQLAALAALRPALPALEAGAEAMAAAISNGGRLIYVAAGSSGLMGMADGPIGPGSPSPWAVPIGRELPAATKISRPPLLMAAAIASAPA